MATLSANRIIYLAPTLAQLDAKQSLKPIRQSESKSVRSHSSSRLTESNSSNNSIPVRIRQEDDSHPHGQECPVEATHNADNTPQPTKSTSETASKQFSVFTHENYIVSKYPLCWTANSSEEHPSSSARASETEKDSTCGNEGNDEIHSTELVKKGKATTNDMEIFFAPKYICKEERLRLGPARAVGMRRLAADEPPLLKALKRPRISLEDQKGEAEANDKRASKRISLLASPLPGEDWRKSFDESVTGVTTADSIPPPPTHDFSLSLITSISTLVSSPNHFLSTHHGGNQFETSLKFNILALVTRMGGLEDVPDWKAGGGKRMDRCELTVKDASECALKIILEGDCATRWATPSDEDASLESEGPKSHDSSMDNRDEQSNVSSEWHSNSLEASISALQDETTSASRTTIERQRDDRLLPLRTGDVIVLSRLFLVRPRQQQRYPSSSSSSSSSKFVESKVTSSYAIASSTSNACLEICWRNDIQNNRDRRRNFDKCLTSFDARCKAIYRLAQSWAASE